MMKSVEIKRTGYATQIIGFCVVGQTDNFNKGIDMECSQTRVTLTASLIIALAVTGCAGTTSEEKSSAASVVQTGKNLMAANDVTYDAPDGWDRREVSKVVTVFTAPEGDASVVVVQVPKAVVAVQATKAKDAQGAAAVAWQMYKPEFSRSIRLNTPVVPSNGWDVIREIEYQTSPAEERLVYANVYGNGGQWTVMLLDGNLGTIVKRLAAARGLKDSLAVAGYTPEDLSGRKAHTLSKARIEALKEFVAESLQQLDIPGAGFALVQDGEVVFEGGVGVKEIGGTDAVDENTLFMIASNTKSMTTLLLAKLVEMGLVDWNDRVIDHYPAFRLGDEETTRSVLIRHLVCACTGLPRNDHLWVFNNDLNTPATITFDDLAASVPTSEFGKIYQYNNQMAAAAGYVAAYVLYPDMEIGAAYDKAMQRYIFDPLGMDDTTMSIADALMKNHARPHGKSLEGKVMLVEQTATTGFNHLVIPYRPAGAAWASPHDAIKYIRNELTEGVGPDGTRLFAAGPLLERRKPFVASGKNKAYGMGLEQEIMSGVKVIRHGGSLDGYKSDIVIIPEAGTGAVIFTNSDNGYSLAKPFGRRLVEILYDGEPAAAQSVSVDAEIEALELTKLREELTLPPDAGVVQKLAPFYRSEELGPLRITFENGQPIMDPGVWSSAFGTRKNPDNTVSLIATDPAMLGFELIVGDDNGKPTLTVNDSQHSYVFVATEE